MMKAQTSRLSITMFENTSEAYPLPDFLEFAFFLTAFAPVVERNAYYERYCFIQVTCNMNAKGQTYLLQCLKTRAKLIRYRTSLSLPSF